MLRRSRRSARRRFTADEHAVQARVTETGALALKSSSCPKLRFP